MVSYTAHNKQREASSRILPFPNLFPIEIRLLLLKRGFITYVSL
ncbi:hypothetical protein EZS27_035041, partial [termite gut metagenome]